MMRAHGRCGACVRLSLCHAARLCSTASWPSANAVVRSDRGASTENALTPLMGGGGMVETFWVHSTVQVPAKALKSQHAEARTLDRRSRFHVRQHIRDDGVLSNLYPLLFSQAETEGAAEGAGAPSPVAGTGVYVYELYATRDFVTTTTTTAAAAAAGAVTPPSATPTDARRGRGHAKSTHSPTKPPRTGHGRGASRDTPTTEAVASSASVGAERRVSSGQAWRVVLRSLRQRMAVLPPMVALRHRVYATVPLADDLLRVPETFWDLGWTRCELRLVGHVRYADLPASELQELVNKIVPWCVGPSQASSSAAVPATSTGSAAGGAALALSREKLGKLVCTSHGISAAGLRVFRGCLVQAVFVDDSRADAPPPQSAPPSRAAASQRAAGAAPPASRTLGDAPEGTVASSALPVLFLVQTLIRSFVYRGRHVESYRITDASGTFLASLWGQTVDTSGTEAGSGGAGASLQVGAVYAATSGVRVRDFPDRGIRLVELEAAAVRLATDPHAQTTATTPQKQDEDDDIAVPETVPSTSPLTTSRSDSGHLGQLALKIDTKGTIASESTLWEEVRQHFGAGPYSTDAQERIARAVQGTPVVVSYSLQQGVVRSVRFPGGGAQPALGAGAAAVAERPSGASGGGAGGVLSRRAMDPALAAIMPRLDPGQPYAVLQDYRLLPLQVLHCCFDPRMRGWQEVAIAALSFMPAQRAQHLAEYRAVLEPRLALWGLSLQAQPWSTRHLALLPVPAKTNASTTAAALLPDRARTHVRHPPPLPYPSTIVVVGVVAERGTADERQRVVASTQRVAQYFKTKLVACVPSEQEAVRYVAETLLVPVAPTSAAGLAGEQRLRDVNAAALIVTLDKSSRATRWVMAECLSRGVLPLAFAPVANPARVNLLCGGLRRQLNVKFGTDPLHGVDLRKEVPSLGQRRVLLVGVDACHTTTLSTGCIVAILAAPERQHVLPVFWRHEARGRETQHVALHFRQVLADAAALYDGLDEVIVFQDGDVFSELNAMKDEIQACVPRCGLTFLCLHKRTNIRFMYNGQGASSPHSQLHNVVKGVVIPALTPVAVDDTSVAPSFYLQTHESNMSTARAVQYTVHHRSPTLDLTEVQQMANTMANVLAPQATKLPMCTRLAHRLSDQAERLLDAVPQMRSELIPAPLNQRLWYL